MTQNFQNKGQRPFDAANFRTSFGNGFDTVVVSGFSNYIRPGQVADFFNLKEGHCVCVSTKNSPPSVVLRFSSPAVAQNVVLRYNNADVYGQKLKICPAHNWQHENPNISQAVEIPPLMMRNNTHIVAPNSPIVTTKAPSLAEIRPVASILNLARAFLLGQQIGQKNKIENKRFVQSQNQSQSPQRYFMSNRSSSSSPQERNVNRNNPWRPSTGNVQNNAVKNSPKVERRDNNAVARNQGAVQKESESGKLLNDKSITHPERTKGLVIRRKRFRRRRFDRDNINSRNREREFQPAASQDSNVERKCPADNSKDKNSETLSPNKTPDFGSETQCPTRKSNGEGKETENNKTTVTLPGGSCKNNAKENKQAVLKDSGIKNEGSIDSIDENSVRTEKLESLGFRSENECSTNKNDNRDNGTRDPKAREAGHTITSIGSVVGNEVSTESVKKECKESIQAFVSGKKCPSRKSDHSKDNGKGDHKTTPKVKDSAIGKEGATDGITNRSVKKGSPESTQGFVSGKKCSTGKSDNKDIGEDGHKTTPNDPVIGKESKTDGITNSSVKKESPESPQVFGSGNKIKCPATKNGNGEMSEVTESEKTRATRKNYDMDNRMEDHKTTIDPAIGNGSPRSDTNKKNGGKECKELPQGFGGERKCLKSKNNNKDTGGGDHKTTPKDSIIGIGDSTKKICPRNTASDTYSKTASKKSTSEEQQLVSDGKNQNIATGGGMRKENSGTEKSCPTDNTNEKNNLKTQENSGADKNSPRTNNDKQNKESRSQIASTQKKTSNNSKSSTKSDILDSSKQTVKNSENLPDGKKSSSENNQENRDDGNPAKTKLTESEKTLDERKQTIANKIKDSPTNNSQTSGNKTKDPASNSRQTSGNKTKDPATNNKQAICSKTKDLATNNKQKTDSKTKDPATSNKQTSGNKIKGTATNNKQTNANKTKDPGTNNKQANANNTKDPATSNKKTSPDKTKDPATNNKQANANNTKDPRTNNKQMNDNETKEPATNNKQSSADKTKDTATNNKQTNANKTKDPATNNKQTNDNETKEPATNNKQPNADKTKDFATNNKQPSANKTKDPATNNKQPIADKTNDPATNNKQTSANKTKEPATNNKQTNDNKTKEPATYNKQPIADKTKDPATNNNQTNDNNTKDPGTNNKQTNDNKTKDPATNNKQTNADQTKDPVTNNKQAKANNTKDPGTNNKQTNDNKTKDPATNNKQTNADQTKDPGTNNKQVNTNNTKDPATNNKQPSADKTKDPATNNTQTKADKTKDPATNNKQTNDNKTEDPAINNKQPSADKTNDPATNDKQTNANKTKDPGTNNKQANSKNTKDPATNNKQTNPDKTNDPATNNNQVNANNTKVPATNNKQTDTNKTRDSGTNNKKANANNTKDPATNNKQTNASKTKDPATNNKQANANKTKDPAIDKQTSAKKTKDPATNNKQTNPDKTKDPAINNNQANANNTKEPPTNNKQTNINKTRDPGTNNKQANANNTKDPATNNKQTNANKTKDPATNNKQANANKTKDPAIDKQTSANKTKDPATNNKQTNPDKTKDPAINNKQTNTNKTRDPGTNNKQAIANNTKDPATNNKQTNGNKTKDPATNNKQTSANKMKDPATNNKKTNADKTKGSATNNKQKTVNKAEKGNENNFLTKETTSNKHQRGDPGSNKKAKIECNQNKSTEKRKAENKNSSSNSVSKNDTSKDRYKRFTRDDYDRYPARDGHPEDEHRGFGRNYDINYYRDKVRYRRSLDESPTRYRTYTPSRYFARDSSPKRRYNRSPSRSPSRNNSDETYDYVWTRKRGLETTTPEKVDKTYDYVWTKKRGLETTTPEKVSPKKRCLDDKNTGRNEKIGTQKVVGTRDLRNVLNSKNLGKGDALATGQKVSTEDTIQKTSNDINRSKESNDSSKRKNREEKETTKTSSGVVSQKSNDGINIGEVQVAGDAMKNPETLKDLLTQKTPEDKKLTLTKCSAGNNNQKGSDYINNEKEGKELKNNSTIKDFVTGASEEVQGFSSTKTISDDNNRKRSDGVTDVVKENRVGEVMKSCDSFKDSLPGMDWESIEPSSTIIIGKEQQTECALKSPNTSNNVLSGYNSQNSSESISCNEAWTVALNNLNDLKYSLTGTNREEKESSSTKTLLEDNNQKKIDGVTEIAKNNQVGDTFKYPLPGMDWESIEPSSTIIIGKEQGTGCDLKSLHTSNDRLSGYDSQSSSEMFSCNEDWTVALKNLNALNDSSTGTNLEDKGSNLSKAHLEDNNQKRIHNVTEIGKNNPVGEVIKSCDTFKDPLPGMDWESIEPSSAIIIGKEQAAGYASIPHIFDTLSDISTATKEDRQISRTQNCLSGSDNEKNSESISRKDAWIVALANLETLNDSSTGKDQYMKGSSLTKPFSLVRNQKASAYNILGKEGQEGDPSMAKNSAENNLEEKGSSLLTQHISSNGRDGTTMEITNNGEENQALIEQEHSKMEKHPSVCNSSKGDRKETASHFDEVSLDVASNTTVIAFNFSDMESSHSENAIRYPSQTVQPNISVKASLKDSCVNTNVLGNEFLPISKVSVKESLKYNRADRKVLENQQNVATISGNAALKKTAVSSKKSSGSGLMNNNLDKLGSLKTNAQKTLGNVENANMATSGVKSTSLKTNSVSKGNRQGTKNSESTAKVPESKSFKVDDRTGKSLANQDQVATVSKYFAFAKSTSDKKGDADLSCDNQIPADISCSIMNCSNTNHESTDKTQFKDAQFKTSATFTNIDDCSNNSTNTKDSEILPAREQARPNSYTILEECFVEPKVATPNNCATSKVSSYFKTGTKNASNNSQTPVKIKTGLKSMDSEKRLLQALTPNAVSIGHIASQHKIVWSSSESKSSTTTSVEFSEKSPMSIIRHALLTTEEARMLDETFTKGLQGLTKTKDNTRDEKCSNSSQMNCSKYNVQRSKHTPATANNHALDGKHDQALATDNSFYPTESNTSKNSRGKVIYNNQTITTSINSLNFEDNISENSLEEISSKETCGSLNTNENGLQISESLALTNITKTAPNIERVERLDVEKTLAKGGLERGSAIDKERFLQEDLLDVPKKCQNVNGSNEASVSSGSIQGHPIPVLSASIKSRYNLAAHSENQLLSHPSGYIQNIRNHGELVNVQNTMPENMTGKKKKRMRRIMELKNRHKKRLSRMQKEQCDQGAANVQSVNVFGPSTQKSLQNALLNKSAQRLNFPGQSIEQISQKSSQAGSCQGMKGGGMFVQNQLSLGQSGNTQRFNFPGQSTEAIPQEASETGSCEEIQKGGKFVQNQIGQNASIQVFNFPGQSTKEILQRASQSSEGHLKNGETFAQNQNDPGLICSEQRLKNPNQCFQRTLQKGFSTSFVPSGKGISESNNGQARLNFTNHNTQEHLKQAVQNSFQTFSSGENSVQNGIGFSSNENGQSRITQEVPNQAFQSGCHNGKNFVQISSQGVENVDQGNFCGENAIAGKRKRLDEPDKSGNKHQKGQNQISNQSSAEVQNIQGNNQAVGNHSVRLSKKERRWHRQKRYIVCKKIQKVQEKYDTDSLALLNSVKMLASVDPSLTEKLKASFKESLTKIGLDLLQELHLLKQNNDELSHEHELQRFKQWNDEYSRQRGMLLKSDALQTKPNNKQKGKKKPKNQKTKPNNKPKGKKKPKNQQKTTNRHLAKIKPKNQQNMANSNVGKRKPKNHQGVAKNQVAQVNNLGQVGQQGKGSVVPPEQTK